MKLICLNIWGGKKYEPLMDFIKKASEDTDIFCFQEVFKNSANRKENIFRINIYNEISKILLNYNSYYASSLNNWIVTRQEVKKTKFKLSYGVSIFIKKDIKVDSYGDFFLFGGVDTFDPSDLNTLPRNAQYVTFINKGMRYIICNVHGIWNKAGKNDSPSRINQSQKIKEFLENHQGGKILVGDFNLDINTKSIKILEEDFRNLIKEYNIPTTRNKYFPGNEKFADYVFVSSEIKIMDFQVPNIEVSDHLPLTVEFY
ncbi:MAG: endonuclease/exonuclease/phosphatase family protein [Patescibacteria group bacterium]